jgi:hypothetical protein
MKSRPEGFVLLEALIAVAIFAIGVIALGRCVSNCLGAERLRFDDIRARQVLENRIAEIQGGAVAIVKEHTEKLPAPLEGWNLKETAVPLKRKNELGQDLTNLVAVTLQVSWPDGSEVYHREILFYALDQPK